MRSSFVWTREQFHFNYKQGARRPIAYVELK